VSDDEMLLFSLVTHYIVVELDKVYDDLNFFVQYIEG